MRLRGGGPSAGWGSGLASNAALAGEPPPSAASRPPPPRPGEDCSNFGKPLAIISSLARSDGEVARQRRDGGAGATGTERRGHPRTTRSQNNGFIPMQQRPRPHRPLHHPADGPPPRSGEDWGLQSPFLHIPPCGIFHHGSLKTESCSHISAPQGAGISPAPHSPFVQQNSPKTEATACFES